LHIFLHNILLKFKLIVNLNESNLPQKNHDKIGNKFLFSFIFFFHLFLSYLFRRLRASLSFHLFLSLEAARSQQRRRCAAGGGKTRGGGGQPSLGVARGGGGGVAHGGSVSAQRVGGRGATVRGGSGNGCKGHGVGRQMLLHRPRWMTGAASVMARPAGVWGGSLHPFFGARQWRPL
jgi:hypothetical protein